VNAGNTRPLPKKFPLATWLSAGSLVIVFAALALMALVSSIIVTRFARQQALARTEVAVSSAREYFRRRGESDLLAARALAENSTLVHLLDAPAAASLGPFLRNYCAAIHATSCIVADPSGSVATSGTAPAWSELAAAHAKQGELFALGPTAGGPPFLGAAAAVPHHAGIQVLVLQSLAGELLREASRASGAAISLLSINSYHATDSDPLTPLHMAALSNGDHAANRVAALDLYAASAVMSNAAGQPFALLDAELAANDFDQLAATFRHAVLIVSIVVAALAGFAGLASGRWLAAPVVRLADMARRIGHGDLSPAIPAVVPRELDALAHTMDEMRQNLVELTTSLRRGEAEAQAVLSGVVEGVFVTDSNRVIVYANPQFSRTAPGAADGAVGRFCGDVLHPTLAAADRPCERDCPIIAARSRGASRTAEHLRAADGTVRSTIVVSAAPAEGRQVQLLRDETDVEAARQARDSILGNISHEFRTPLAAQLASIEMLRDGIATLNTAQQSELLANVERGVLRLMRLIDNLLESVRIESAQLSMRHQEVDLEGTAHEAAELLKPLLAPNGLSIAIDLRALEGCVVPGDSQRLQQVFVNLLSNAAKFAPFGSVIRIGAQVSDTQVEAWVEDSGPGVSAGDPEKIFGRFNRGASAEPDAPGLGLGLWIVRSIVERHAGSVRVERTAAAQTRFVFTLPLESRLEDTAG
jgi:signal transduction histidine kinase/HAMP domain-containing protein/type II secretory pathway pseudopilin PulG